MIHEKVVHAVVILITKLSDDNVTPTKDSARRVAEEISRFMGLNEEEATDLFDAANYICSPIPKEYDGLSVGRIIKSHK